MENLSQPQSIPGDVSPSQGDCPEDFVHEEIIQASLDNLRQCSQNSNKQDDNDEKIIQNKTPKTSNIISKYEKNYVRKSLSPKKIKNKTKSSQNSSNSKSKHGKQEKSTEKNLKKKLPKKKSRNITLREAVEIIKKKNALNITDSTLSSINESFSIELFENPLEQPPRDLSGADQIRWLQERRIVGLWVYCDRPGCNKMRWLENVVDPTELPEFWYCDMNPGKFLLSITMVS